MNENSGSSNRNKKIDSDDVINLVSDSSDSDESCGSDIEMLSDEFEIIDCECDSWDNDCRVITDQYKHITNIQGYHLMPTCDRDPDLQVAKRQKISLELRKTLLEQSTINEFRENWNSNENHCTKSYEIISDPFKLCVLNNFIENKSLLDELRQEFYELDWNTRNMDLYEFFQSKDLKHLTSDIIQLFYNFLKENVMKWVSELTGMEFTNISATCSLYSNTDYLLVHDDQREDRSVAFVLYLTENTGWCKEKGGALDLLSTNGDGHPNKVIRSVYPSNNQLVFFPVTNNSYHQVAEVTTLSDCRLSINGWFHTKVAPIYTTPLFIPIENSLYSNNKTKSKEVDIDLESWIEEEYLWAKRIKSIKLHIEEHSEISLHLFFKEVPFKEISENLKNKDIQWSKVGPPNRYLYEIADLNSLPHSLERFINLFQSKQMFDLLMQYTELNFDNEDAGMKFELQRWKPGSYCLLSDYDWDKQNELDLILYFGFENSSDIIGARTQYVTLDDEVQDALMTIEPEVNSLNIVYRDSARFTKYFSKQSKCKCFYRLICSYSE